jgi:hypothetical protein
MCGAGRYDFFRKIPSHVPSHSLFICEIEIHPRILREW